MPVLAGPLLIGTAHNELELHTPPGPSQTASCVVLPSPQQVLLYSMSAHGHTLETLRVAAGTAIGGVLVWDVVAAPEVPLVKWQISGHDGVIFRTIWSDRTTLCTASDDRTARMWTLADSGEYTQQHACYGHRSRVWDVIPLDGATRYVTCSEDASVRIWDSDQQCTAVLEGHAGRGVWRIAHCETGGTELLATGGNDGTTRLWRKGQATAEESSSWPLPEPTWWTDETNKRGTNTHDKRQIPDKTV